MTTHENLPENFLLVGLDDASLSLDTLEPEEIAGSKALQLMEKGFPWSREVYALAGQKMIDAGAKLVIFDMVYPGPNPALKLFAAFLKESRTLCARGAFREAACAQSTGHLPCPHRLQPARPPDHRWVTPVSPTSVRFGISCRSPRSRILKGNRLWKEKRWNKRSPRSRPLLWGKAFPVEIRRPLRFRYPFRVKFRRSP